MGQVFPRSANFIARLSIVVVVVLVGAAGAFLVLAPESFSAPVQTQAITQPISFSHKQHVNDTGIDCRYCHTTAETSAFAGMPSTQICMNSQICMNCHSEVLTSSEALAPVRDSDKSGKPIVWTRVHNLPGFAYFDHSAHVTNGVACVTCHGQVDQMTVAVQTASLRMSWCMGCHQNPAPAIRPRDQITNMRWQPPDNFAQIRQQLLAEYHVESKTSCSTCHR
jgi:ferredoxin